MGSASFGRRAVDLVKPYFPSNSYDINSTLLLIYQGFLDSVEPNPRTQITHSTMEEFMYIDIFAEAFRGCGTPIQSVLASPEYGNALDQEKALENQSRKTDTGIAWNAGIMKMNQLFNQLPESLVVEEAKGLLEGPRPAAEIRAMTRILGSFLIESASSCLTEVMKTMAEKWKTSSSNEQVQICTKLMHDLQSEGQGKVGYEAEDATLEKLATKQERAWNIWRQGREAVLPGLYGNWNPKTNPANCQGKSQMVVAFARLAGAIAVAIHPSLHARTSARKSMNRITHQIRDDLIRRDLLEVDSGVMEGIYCSLSENQLDILTESYHVGVAIELSNGKWFMVDPHGRSHGLVPESFSISSVYRHLKKYHDVLPELCIQEHDNGELMAQLAEFEKRAEYFLERSRKVEEELKDVQSLMELVDYIEGSSDLDMLADFLGITETGWLASENRKMLVMSIVVNTENLWDIHLKMFEVMHDKAFLENRKKSWMTVFHAAAFSPLVKTANTASFVHPVVDVGSAEWHLAVAALNTISIDLFPDFRDRENGTLFASFSADQTTLFNVLAGSRQTYSELAKAAHQTLASYRIRYPLSERFLKNPPLKGGE
jgi:hypothetical protein